MYDPNAIRREVRALVRLAVPVALTQLAAMMLWVVDLLMVGRLGVEPLAAASLGRSWVIATLILGSGLVLGMDPVTAQAHGARNRSRVGLSLQWGLVIAGAASVPIVLAWLFTETLLTATGQDPGLAHEAHRYLLVQIPGVPCYLGFLALRQWLQGRGITRPALWIALLANLVNAFANYALIFGAWGAPALGLTGAGIATALTQLFMLSALALVVYRFRIYRGGWDGWSREAFDPAGLRTVLGHGWPVATQLGLELWAFSGSTLLVGLLGAAELASHTLVLNLASISFMVPLGIGISAVTRVGNRLGAGDPAGARRAAAVAMALGGGVMLVFALLFVLGRDWLPRLYTPDPAVWAISAAILPIAAAFQLFDGVQVVAAGALRGAGTTRPAAVFNFLGYYLVALPLGGWWALRAGGGIEAVWWSLCLGLALVAVMLVAWVRLRGPGARVL